ncbi:MAG TPA: DEAD/DEAH box helicase [Tepidisphaeraceae bacterium]|nr:DEAD/DEAH box helicase [Tepidisphaeraceae bacterium]
MTDKAEHPPLPEKFAALGVRPSILKGLAEAKFETPSEIQALLIPRALGGGDLLGQARTGTGKTAAFGIPILQRAAKGVATQAIILVPTRELAVQVDAELKRLGQYTPLRTCAVYGGQKIMAQMKFLRHGPEILVGTPGRVIDLLDRRIINFNNVRFVVLDEVDRMLDIGFRDDIRNILSRVKGMSKRLPPDARGGDQAVAVPSSREHRGAARDAEHDGNGDAGLAPEAATSAPDATDDAGDDAAARDLGGHQTIFVSATISDEIEKLARRYMREPVEKLIAPGADDKPTVEEVEQYYFSVQPWDKYRLLKNLLLKENPDLAIVFTRTKRGAEKLAKRLHADGIECREIHGNLAQNKRERVMANFRHGKFDVLIATDLASRGIDVADISHIINYDIPEDPEVYVHRVGRTARMGAKGKAYTFVQRDQGDELTKVENLINMVIPVATLEGWEPRPEPSDWTEHKPGQGPALEAKPVQNRFERPYSPSGSANAAPVAGADQPAPITIQAPPRTIGSKIPINRRHKRRR